MCLGGRPGCWTAGDVSDCNTFLVQVTNERLPWRMANTQLLWRTTPEPEMKEEFL